MGAALAAAAAGPAGLLSELDGEHGELAGEPWCAQQEIPSFHTPCPALMVPSSSMSLPGSCGPAVLGDPFQGLSRTHMEAVTRGAALGSEVTQKE